MCGRFTFATPGEIVAEVFGLQGAPVFDPRYNIAPTQPVAALRLSAGRLEVAAYQWGLVPAWARDTAIGNRLINARSETAAAKPSFRAAWRSRRCGVLADGFFEWQKLGGRKQPWLFRRRDRRPFAIAGLWESWLGAAGSTPLETCTLLTTAANHLVGAIHDRMPVILEPADLARWLSGPGSHDEELMVPAPEQALEAIAVSPRVNNPRFDDPSCLDPLDH